MRFEEALKAMREGKKVTAPSVTDNSLYLVDDSLYVDDGLNDLYIGGVRTTYILAEDWSILE